MKAKICTGVAVSVGLLLLMPSIYEGMAAGSPPGAAGSPAGAARATNSFTVGLTVEDALGVSLDGRISSERAIRIGDPAAGLVSYVILDG